MKVLRGTDFIIYELNGQYSINWYRGRERFSYPIDEDLVKKALLTSKDGKEVMFYVEHGRWPEEDELEHYNESNVITHRGNNFIVYEENGKYEMHFMTGGFQDREVIYPISKELMERAFESPQDAYEVKIYLMTGHWPDKSQEELDRNFLRQFPEQILKNPTISKTLFSEYEFTKLLKQAIETVLQTSKIDSLGIVEEHLELLLLDPIKWQEETEIIHLQLLQEKLNNYIHFIESKQYVDSYGDDFTEKVINLTFQYAPSDNGLAFLVQVQKVLQPTDICLKVVVPK
ncbi:DUF6572 domain-containing protein [Streptococcus suis]|uniref:DUF6572 domain-containing protein n=2 Tax=Streptococcus suis TaxID=1307 RepID=UPI00192D6B94|nr:DUF6572 domain-containing protein [Streptococcus suis]